MIYHCHGHQRAHSHSMGVLLEQTMRPESSYNTISDRSICTHIYLNRAEEARCMVIINDSAHHV